MTKKPTSLQLPFPPLLCLDAPRPVEEDVLKEVIRSRPSGVSLLVRPTGGTQKRGGYFFHVKLDRKTEPSLVLFYDFHNNDVTALPTPEATALINHCTGLAFSEDIWRRFHLDLNFRKDT